MCIILLSAGLFAVYARNTMYRIPNIPLFQKHSNHIYRISGVLEIQTEQKKFISLEWLLMPGSWHRRRLERLVRLFQRRQGMTLRFGERGRRWMLPGRIERRVHGLVRL